MSQLLVAVTLSRVVRVYVPDDGRDFPEQLTDALTLAGYNPDEMDGHDILEVYP
jgi:hypothetical protein